MLKETIQLLTILTLVIIIPSTIMTLQQNFTGSEYYIILTIICILLTLWASVIRLLRFK